MRDIAEATELLRVYWARRLTWKALPKWYSRVWIRQAAWELRQLTGRPNRGKAARRVAR